MYRMCKFIVFVNFFFKRCLFYLFLFVFLLLEFIFGSIGFQSCSLVLYVRKEIFICMRIIGLCGNLFEEYIRLNKSEGIFDNFVFKKYSYSFMKLV